MAEPLFFVPMDIDVFFTDRTLTEVREGSVGILSPHGALRAYTAFPTAESLGTYKGAIYENIVADMLVKQGYGLYYYSSDKPYLEMDFFVRSADSLIPVEVKAKDGATASLNNLLKREKYSDIKYGIKLGHLNIGFNGKFFTFPYFLTFLLKRFIRDNNNFSNFVLDDKTNKN